MKRGHEIQWALLVSTKFAQDAILNKTKQQVLAIIVMPQHHSLLRKIYLKWQLPKPRQRSSGRVCELTEDTSSMGNWVKSWSWFDSRSNSVLFWERLPLSSIREGKAPQVCHMNAISQSQTGLQNKTLLQINKKQNKQETHTQKALPRARSGGTHL